MNFKSINAGTFLRILEFFNQGKTFGLLSAARSGLSEEENLQRHKDLLAQLKQSGFGYISGGGGYTYLSEAGQKLTVPEPSVFIPGIPKNKLRGLAISFQQESYIFSEKHYWEMISSKNNQVLAHGTDLQMLSEDSDPDYFSKFKDKKFKLTHLAFRLRRIASALQEGPGRKRIRLTTLQSLW